MTSTSKLLLSSGRQLAFRRYGKPGGRPVIFAHGNLNSRLFEPAWNQTESLTAAAGANVIAVDRPGVGLSDLNDPHSNSNSRTYLDFANDMRQLADHLELEASGYSMVGFSSGGPHALACAAARLPGLESVALVSSDAPYYKMNMNEKLFGAGAVDLELGMEMAEKNAAGMRKGYSKLEKEGRAAAANADLDAAILQGFAGPGSDSVLEAAPEWGFDMEMEKGGGGPALRIWHGTADDVVPVEAGRYLAAECAGFDVAAVEAEGGGERGRHRYYEVEGENHTMVRRLWSEILRDVIAAAEK